MEKKLLAVLFIIGFIIYLFIMMLPFLVGGAIIVGVVRLLYRQYVKHPNEYAKWGAKLIIPILIMGWIYIGYFCYANLYYNTYYIEATDSDINPFPHISFIAKNNDEAKKIAWDKLYDKNKDEIDNYPYENRYQLFNHTKGELVLYTIFKGCENY